MNTPNLTDTAEFVRSPFAQGLERPPSNSMRAQVDVAGLSHQGRVRANNEDHFLVARFGRHLDIVSTNLPEEQGRFEEAGYGLLVADGVGGSAAGEVASALAIRLLLNLVLHSPDWILRLDDEESAEEAVRRATERYQQVNELLTQQAEGDARLHGFGTTMTLARSLGKDLLIVNVGDSRAYLLRRGRLHQLTRDHTVAQSLADSGLISPTEVGSHRLRHMVTEVLGHHGRQVRPDVQTLALEDNDCLLLCTDGLTDMVEDRVIAEALNIGAPAERCCHELVERALAAGGRDNVTVIVAHYQFAGEATEQAHG